MGKGLCSGQRLLSSCGCKKLETASLSGDGLHYREYGPVSHGPFIVWSTVQQLQPINQTFYQRWSPANVNKADCRMTLG